MGLAVATALAFTVPARAALTPEEIACRTAIAKSMGKYVKTAQKAVATCHKLRDSGKIDAGTACNVVATADSKGKVTAAFGKAHAALTAACQTAPTILAEFGRCPAPFETVDDAGADGIESVSELLLCLAAHADNLVQTTARSVLGSPTVPLDAELAKCHGALAKGYTKYVDTIVKTRAKCQSASDKAGGPLGFGCVLDDGGGKITAAKQKAAAAITAACSAIPTSNATSRARGAYARGTPDLDSCAVQLNDLLVCVLDKAADKSGTGMAAMMWELPGVCPAKGSYLVVPVPTGTELDVGWTGLGHDRDPILGYRGVQIGVSCDTDCKNCASTTVTPSPDACRCSGNATASCTTDGDCGGAAPCQCYYGPPTPYTAGGAGACVQSIINGPMAGSLDPATGDLSLDIPLLHRIYIGIGINLPCPTCVGGTCNGGVRNGLACAIDATDATFGAVSYDCPPSPLANISGFGVTTDVHYTTGSVSLPFATTCDFPYPGTCACGACSLDPSRACNANAYCASFGAGVCNNAGGSLRGPNDCYDLTCSPAADPGEGTCLAGPDDEFCDGFLSANGGGIIFCSTNGDCAAMNPACPGGDCGTCSVSRKRECFLNPIAATGTPGESIVGVGCIGTTNNGAVNGALGWPGAYRVKQKLAVDLLCPDGTTEFIPPGGSNCP